MQCGVWKYEVLSAKLLKEPCLVSTFTTRSTPKLHLSAPHDAAVVDNSAILAILRVVELLCVGC